MMMFMAIYHPDSNLMVFNKMWLLQKKVCSQKSENGAWSGPWQDDDEKHKGRHQSLAQL